MKNNYTKPELKKLGKIVTETLGKSGASTDYQNGVPIGTKPSAGGG